MLVRSILFAITVFVLHFNPLQADDQKAADWSVERISKLPAGETPILLFNGKDLDGWEGHVGKYFTVENGMIVGRNSNETAPKSSG